MDKQKTQSWITLLQDNKRDSHKSIRKMINRARTNRHLSGPSRARTSPKNLVRTVQERTIPKTLSIMMLVPLSAKLMVGDRLV
jgi:hypothetical protein